MTQKHHTNGELQVYFTGSAVKLVSNRGAQYLSKAPDWDVYAFRLDDKIICHVTRNQYNKKQGFKPLLRMREADFLGSGQICSLPAKIYRQKHRTLWVAKLPGIPVEVAELICAYFKEPAVDGLMLKCVSSEKEVPVQKESAFKFLNDRSTGVTLDTLKVQAVPY